SGGAMRKSGGGRRGPGSAKICAKLGKRRAARPGAVGYDEAMKTILAPIDFSTASDAVVEEAGALARAFNGRVVLLTVIQPPVILNEYSALMDNLAEITAAGEKHAARQ